MSLELKENGTITRTHLGSIEGRVVCSVMIEGDSWGQAFSIPRDRFHEILAALEVEEWEQLNRTPVRIERKEHLGPIVRLGHYTKNLWVTA